MRKRRNHWGPINRKELDLDGVEIADELLREVETILEGVDPEPEPVPPEPSDNRVEIVANHPEEVEVTVTGDVYVTVNGAPGLVFRSDAVGDTVYAFEFAQGAIRAIYVSRNPDKLAPFLRQIGSK